jgi:hypothetical protein
LIPRWLASQRQAWNELRTALDADGLRFTRFEKIHQRMEFINAVLDGRAGENEGITAAEAFHRRRGNES